MSTLSLTATTDPSYPQAIKTSRPGVGVVVTDSQNNIISPCWWNITALYS